MHIFLYSTLSTLGAIRSQADIFLILEARTLTLRPLLRMCVFDPRGKMAEGASSQAQLEVTERRLRPLYGEAYCVILKFTPGVVGFECV